MIHQPLGGAQGGQTDIDIQVITTLLYGTFKILHLVVYMAIYWYIEYNIWLRPMAESQSLIQKDAIIRIPYSEKITFCSMCGQIKVHLNNALKT